VEAKGDPKQIVARGYDAIALRYAAWAATLGAPTMRYVRELDRRLPNGADVLELGCGRGVPATRELAKRHRVTGVDISAAQIALARHHVPEATFVHADMTELDLPPESFHGVVALFSILHVPRDEQGELLERIGDWLRQGGLFLATLGVGGSPGSVEEDWLGAPMYSSSWDEDTYRELLGAAGLELVVDRIETQVEHERPVAFLWVLGEKPG
jgi:SAM-dependent methyltransferase